MTVELINSEIRAECRRLADIAGEDIGTKRVERVRDEVLQRHGLTLAGMQGDMRTGWDEGTRGFAPARGGGRAGAGLGPAGPGVGGDPGAPRPRRAPGRDELLGAWLASREASRAREIEDELTQRRAFQAWAEEERQEAMRRELRWLRKYVESAERRLYGGPGPGGGDDCGGLEGRLRSAEAERDAFRALEERALAELGRAAAAPPALGDVLRRGAGPAATAPGAWPDGGLWSELCGETRRAAHAARELRKEADGWRALRERALRERRRLAAALRESERRAAALRDGTGMPEAGEAFLEAARGEARRAADRDRRVAASALALAEEDAQREARRGRERARASAHLAEDLEGLVRAARRGEDRALHAVRAGVTGSVLGGRAELRVGVPDGAAAGCRDGAFGLTAAVDLRAEGGGTPGGGCSRACAGRVSARVDGSVLSHRLVAADWCACRGVLEVRSARDEPGPGWVLGARQRDAVVDAASALLACAIREVGGPGGPGVSAVAVEGAAGGDVAGDVAGEIAGEVAARVGGGGRGRWPDPGIQQPGRGAGRDPPHERDPPLDPRSLSFGEGMAPVSPIGGP